MATTSSPIFIIGGPSPLSPTSTFPRGVSPTHDVQPLPLSLKDLGSSGSHHLGSVGSTLVRVRPHEQHMGPDEEGEANLPPCGSQHVSKYVDVSHSLVI